MAEDSATDGGGAGEPSDVGGASGADHEIDADATSGANDPPGRSGDEERVSGAQIAVKGSPVSKSRRLSTELLAMGYSDSASGTPARLKAAEVDTPIAKAVASAVAAKSIVRMVDQGTQMERGDRMELHWEGALSTSRNKRDNSKGDEERRHLFEQEESTSLDACVADMGVCAPKDGEENGNNVDDEDDDPALLKRRQRAASASLARTQR